MSNFSSSSARDEPTPLPSGIEEMAAPCDLPEIALPCEADGRGRPREGWIRINGKASVRNVTSATLMPFLPPAAQATGAAMIVAPGGAFLIGSMENEAWPMARWLAERGIAAFVLKYRLEPTPESMDALGFALLERFAAAAAGERLETIPAFAIADAQAAIGQVRERSAEWGIDPKMVGFLGFSAGAIAGIQAVAEDKPGCSPDLLAAIYPSMEALTLPETAPPLFVAIAEDDPLWTTKGFGLIQSWHSAGSSAECHVYRSGGHGFGLGDPATTAGHWTSALQIWLTSMGATHLPLG